MSGIRQARGGRDGCLAKHWEAVAKRLAVEELGVVIGFGFDAAAIQSADRMPSPSRIKRLYEKGDGEADVIGPYFAVRSCGRLG